MVAAVAVENINIVDLVKLMFQGIAENTLVTPGSKPLPRRAVIPAF